MVVVRCFQDVFDASQKTVVLSLPHYKENILNVEFGNSCKNNKTQFNGSEPLLPFSASKLFEASVVDWRRLTADDKECKAVYEITLDNRDSNFSYKPGDTIGIVPRNNKTEVDFLLNHLTLTSVADLWYNLSVDSHQNCSKTKLPTYIPVSSTIRHVLTHCLDIRGIVKKLFLLALSRYTKDDTERKVLEYLCSKEGAIAYTTHVLNTNICLLDILANFKSCKPPVEVLLQHLPRLLPRPYSIVNSPHKNPHIIKICFSVMDIGNGRKGLTTGWLENIILNKELCLEDALNNLSVTDKKSIPIYLRKNMNSFELSDTIGTPIILIGPGTGVAPYIGFLEQIELLKNKGHNELCEIWLFFGCRHPNLDFIYQQELNEFIDKKILSSLKTAYSRHGNSKVLYVQDAIMENGEDIVRLIKNGSRIFVCGDVKTMAVQVQDAIIKCLVKYDSRTTAEAEKLVSDLQKDKIYITDIWN